MKNDNLDEYIETLYRSPWAFLTALVSSVALIITVELVKGMELWRLPMNVVWNITGISAILTLIGLGINFSIIYFEGRSYQKGKPPLGGILSSIFWAIPVGVLIQCIRILNYMQNN